MSFIIILFIDIPPLIRKKKGKELTLVCFILCFGLVLSILYVSKISLPSPVVAIDNFLKDVLNLGYSK